MAIREKISLKKKWTIRKYADKVQRALGKPYEVCEFEGNVLLNEGIQLLEDLLIGASGTPYSNANAYLGVGDDGTTAEGATQTGLQGTNKAYAPMNTGYPQRTNQTLSWQADFDGSTANFDWREFTVVNANSDTGTNLNRKVSSQGTKASGQIWTLQLDITIS